MSSEQIYRCCWKRAHELLQGLQTNDLRVIEQRLKPLRDALAVRHGLAGREFDAGAFLRVEQLDLLEGITASVEASVAAIRGSSRPHLLRMQTAESLLRHLVDQPGHDGQSRLPVC